MRRILTEKDVEPAAGPDGGHQNGPAQAATARQQVGDPGQNQSADDGDGDIRIWRHGRSLKVVRRHGVESDSILPRLGGIPPRSPGGFGDSVSGRTAGVE